jgi:WD40 repeat protein
MPDDDRDDRERRLDEVLGAFLADEAKGRAPSPDELIARHPELASELNSFFANRQQVRCLLDPLLPPEAAPTAAKDPAGAPAAGRGRTEDADPAAPDGDGDGRGRSADPWLGSRVRYFGDYELKDVLGRGGMGVVYRAVQLSLDRPVALKMIRAGLWAEAEEVRRFKNEAEAIARFDHPAIVAIHEVGQFQGQHYFSMQLVEGTSLDRVLGDYATAPRKAARLAAEAARALHHAHQRGILHRDVKPSNILIDRGGHPHITDFGLAKRLGAGDDGSVSGAVMGTPQYMSPEQAAGHHATITTATDVYGLGATLYAALTCRAPFGDGSVLEILQQVQTRVPERPSAVNREVDRDLETICLKCLEKDPKGRYGSAEAAAEDLERYLRGEPIEARPTGAAERLVKWARRRPAAAALVGVSILAALILVGLGVALAYQSRLQAAYTETERQRGIAETQRAIAETALASERRFLYYNRVLFADRELQDNNPYRAEELLDQCPVEQRHWEWHHLKRMCHGELFGFRAHSGNIASVAFSPDGRLIATGAYDPVVRIWDAETGRAIRALGGHGEGYSYVAFSPDSSRLASVCGLFPKPGCLLVHEVVTGRLLLAVPLKTGATAQLAYRPGGRELAVTSGDVQSDGWVQFLDARTARNRLTIPVPGKSAYTLAFSPDGSRLAVVVGKLNAVDSVPSGEIWVFDTETGRLSLCLEARGVILKTVAFSPDGRKIASGGIDGTAYVWGSEDGRELLTYHGRHKVANQVRFSPDGRQIASIGFEGCARVWDAETGRDLLVLRGHHRSGTELAFQPGRGRLATAGADGMVKIWDTTASKGILTLSGHPSRVFSIAFGPDGRTLVSAGMDKTVRVWDVQDGTMRLRLTGHTQSVWGVAFSPDGTQIASAAGDWTKPDQLGEVRLWDATTGSVRHALRAHKGIAWSVVFRPDGRKLASSGGELRTPGQELILWDVETGHRLRTIPDLPSGVRRVAYSPDGRQLAACLWKDIRIWDAETGQVLLPSLGTDYIPTGFTYSRDGRSIITGSAAGSVGLWNARTGRLIQTFEARAQDVAISPDGRRIASGGSERTIKVWDADNGQELITLHPRAEVPIYGVAFSQDGHRIAGCDEEGLINIWDGTPVEGGAL